VRIARFPIARVRTSQDIIVVGAWKKKPRKTFRTAAAGIRLRSAAHTQLITPPPRPGAGSYLWSLADRGRAAAQCCTYLDGASEC